MEGTSPSRGGNAGQRVGWQESGRKSTSTPEPEMRFRDTAECWESFHAKQNRQSAEAYVASGKCLKCLENSKGCGGRAKIEGERKGDLWSRDEYIKCPMID